MRDRLMIGPPGVSPVTPPKPGLRPPAGSTAAAPGFRGELEKAFQSTPVQPVRLSAHAEDRLRASGRSLRPDELERLAGAVDKAAQKGARESLVIMSDLALVVSVRSRTVITAMDGQRMKENLFTNIDSAVILD